jgi:hypothetical protein
MPSKAVLGVVRVPLRAADCRSFTPLRVQLVDVAPAAGGRPGRRRDARR